MGTLKGVVPIQTDCSDEGTNLIDSFKNEQI